MKGGVRMQEVRERTPEAPVMATPEMQTQEMQDGQTQAAPGGWFHCRVDATGPAEDGTIFIHLTEVNNAFSNWYYAVPTMKREMLATALTAYSLGQRVALYVTSTDGYSQINRFYLANWA